jgi:Polyketide cyclase / dehydrase and lipid transport
MARALLIEETIRIACAPDTVWTMVTDSSADHLWRPGITEMTPDPPGPPAVGTHVREVLNTGGRSFVTNSTVTSVGPGMTYRVAGTGTTGGVEGSRTVVASGDGVADFSYRVERALVGAYRLMRPLVGATMRKGLRNDLERLRVLLERRDAASDGPGPEA